MTEGWTLSALSPAAKRPGLPWSLRVRKKGTIRTFLVAPDRPDRAVQPPDLGRLGPGRLLDRQHVGEQDPADAGPAGAADHLPEVGGGHSDLLEGAVRQLSLVGLEQVVGAALDQQHVGSLGAAVEPQRDLVGALAGDAAVAEAKPRLEAVGPVLVLAAPRHLAVPVALQPGPPLRIGVPSRPAGRDRVSEGGDQGAGAPGRAAGVPTGHRRRRGRSRPRRTPRRRSRRGRSAISSSLPHRPRKDTARPPGHRAAARRRTACSLTGDRLPAWRGERAAGSAGGDWTGGSMRTGKWMGVRLGIAAATVALGVAVAAPAASAGTLVRFDRIQGVDSPGTPAKYDRVGILKTGPRRAPEHPRAQPRDLRQRRLLRAARQDDRLEDEGLAGLVGGAPREPARGPVGLQQGQGRQGDPAAGLRLLPRLARPIRASPSTSRRSPTPTSPTRRTGG